MEAEHCVIEHKDGIVVLHPIEGSLCAVNGQVIKEPTRLTQGMNICMLCLVSDVVFFFFSHRGFVYVIAALTTLETPRKIIQY